MSWHSDLALWRQKQVDLCEFEAGLGYRANPRKPELHIEVLSVLKTDRQKLVIHDFHFSFPSWNFYSDINRKQLGCHPG